MFPSFKNFALRVLLPSTLLLILVNLLVSERLENDPQKRIQAAVASGNYAAAKAEYRKLIENDFFKVEYHRGYIRSHLGQPGRLRSARRKDNEEMIAEYRRYASSNNPDVSDIGHYGLGYFYSVRNEYDRALENFEKVRNRKLPYLNGSLGSLYRRMDQFDLAKQHLYREIELKGNISGAITNLAELFYVAKQYDELDALTFIVGIKNLIPPTIRRFLALRQGRYGDYVWEALAFRQTSAYGLIGALLILGAWFVYLRQIDVFEPEPVRYAVVTLLGGMIFSCLSVPLYDVYEFVLRFRTNGTFANDLLFYIFAVGLIEETLKVLPVLLVMRFTRAINESVDYVIYGSLSALGFAFMENLLPFYEWRPGAISTRAFSAVILHMTLTAIVMYGIFYSRYRAKKNPVLYFLLAFGTACALHGLYDFLLLKGWFLLGLLLLVYCIREYGVAINCSLNLSEYNSDHANRVVDLTRYLCYSLAAIVMLQYVIIAINYGPKSANFNFLKILLSSYLLLCVILASLRTFEIHSGEWLPLLRKRLTSS